MLASKKNERLDSVVSKLKDHIGFVEKNSIKDNDESKTDPEIAAKNNSCGIHSGDYYLNTSYLMWQNTANSCWLDASMALLVHNRTLTQSISESSNAQIAKIIECYYKAIENLNNYPDSKNINERVQDSKDMLRTVQESVLKYLQPILKYKQGKPDSAFCSLYNLIGEDKAVENFFQLEYTWVQECLECKIRRPKTHRKPIITLPRVESFEPSSPISLYQCLVCNAPDQKMMLHFRTLPQCLLFHFENGAGEGELLYSSFKVDGRTYSITGVMTLEKGRESNSNHFVTYIRDPPSDTWMECNDLWDDVMCFSVIPPFIQLQDVYILMFEAMDGNSTVPNFSLAAEVDELGKESSFESGDVPFIDLENEAEENKAEAHTKKSKEFEKKDLSIEESIKDAVEKACSLLNDLENVSFKSTDSIEIDPACGSSKVGLFGLDCEEDSSKLQSEHEGLLKKVNENKYDGIDNHKSLNGTLSETFSEIKHFENCSMKEQPQIYESICSNYPKKRLLTAKMNKAKPMLQKKRSKTPNVIGKKKIKKLSQFKKNDSCDFNLLNNPHNTSLIANQSRATYLPKNRKRMNNSKGEAATKMNGIPQENVSSNMCLNQSSENGLPKRNQVRKSVSVDQQQNGTNNEMAMDTMSDCNNQNDKTTLNMNEPSPSSSDSKPEPPHGENCTCVGMKMNEDLLDVVLHNVLKNVFNFLGIEEKR